MQFTYLTAARDRRKDLIAPSDLGFESTDEAEQLAFDMHRMWYDEAKQFGDLVAYAKYKLRPAVEPALSRKEWQSLVA